MDLVTLIETTKYRYNPKVVAGLIRSNRRRYGTVRPDTRMIVFLMTNKTTQNGISYFYNVRKNKNFDLSYVEAHDIAADLYAVCDACIDAFDETKGEFFFQYHTAVTRKMRKMMSSKSSSEVSYGFINQSDTYSDEEGMEKLLNDVDGNETEYDFDMMELSKVLTDRQRNFVDKFMKQDKTPVAKDFGTNQTGYVEAINRIVKRIENEQPKKSMDKNIFLDKEFHEIPKNRLPQEGEETLLVCRYTERVKDDGCQRFEILHHKHDGEEWDYFHLAIFNDGEDAIIFADAKIRRLKIKA